MTIIRTKVSFLLRPGNTAVSTRNKERREVPFVGSTRSNGTVTSRCRPWRNACLDTSGTVVPVFRQQKFELSVEKFVK